MIRVYPKIKCLWPRTVQFCRGLGGSGRLIVVGSAHKVGSTWLSNMLRDLYVCPAYSIPREVKTRFKTACGGDWDSLLLELGYETTGDW